MVYALSTNDVWTIVFLVVVFIGALVGVFLHERRRNRRGIRVMDRRDNQVLYEDQAAGPMLSVMVGGEPPPGERMTSMSKADITHLINEAREPMKMSVASWLVPALLVLLGAAGAAAAQYFKHSPVDCVAYVNSLEAIQKDFPNLSMDLGNLKKLYGTNTASDCGEPVRMFTTTVAPSATTQKG